MGRIAILSLDHQSRTLRWRFNNAFYMLRIFRYIPDADLRLVLPSQKYSPKGNFNSSSASQGKITGHVKLGHSLPLGASRVNI